MNRTAALIASVPVAERPEPITHTKATNPDTGFEFSVGQSVTVKQRRCEETTKGFVHVTESTTAMVNRITHRMVYLTDTAGKQRVASRDEIFTQ
jgi:hypothetical protein